MDAPDTVTEATRMLRDDGYDNDAQVRDGAVHLRVDGDWVRCEDVDVERIHRFEGMSDPGDEMIVLGVHARGRDERGVLVAAYGPDMSYDDARCLRRLADDRGSA